MSSFHSSISRIAVATRVRLPGGGQSAGTAGTTGGPLPTPPALCFFLLGVGAADGGASTECSRAATLSAAICTKSKHTHRPKMSALPVALGRSLKCRYCALCTHKGPYKRPYRGL